MADVHDPSVPTERVAAQAAAFDQIGARYDEFFPHKDGQVAAGRRMLERMPAGAHVLDVGCGTGLPTARQLVEGGVDLVGIDISPVMVALARANVPRARFLEADILHLQPDLGPFDGIVAFFSLLMLSRVDIPPALESIRQMLAPGGWFALAMVEADLDDVPIPFLGSTIRVSGYPRAELGAIVQAAGFAIEEQADFSYAPAAAGAPPEIQIFLDCRPA